MLLPLSATWERRFGQRDAFLSDGNLKNADNLDILCPIYSKNKCTSKYLSDISSINNEERDTTGSANDEWINEYDVSNDYVIPEELIAENEKNLNLVNILSSIEQRYTQNDTR